MSHPLFLEYEQPWNDENIKCQLWLLNTAKKKNEIRMHLSCSQAKLTSWKSINLSDNEKSNNEGWQSWQIHADPLHNPVTWYGIKNYCAETQITQWDFQNNWKELVLVQLTFRCLELPPCNLHPIIINSVPCDRILQRRILSWFDSDWRPTVDWQLADRFFGELFFTITE